MFGEFWFSVLLLNACVEIRSVICFCMPLSAKFSGLALLVGEAWEFAGLVGVVGLFASDSLFCWVAAAFSCLKAAVCSSTAWVIES